MSDDVLTFDTEKSEWAIRKNSMFDNLVEFNSRLNDNVQGWFYPQDSIIFHQLLNDVQSEIQGPVCEIGVSFGKSATALSYYKRKEDDLYLFDLFEDDVRQIADTNIELFGNHENIKWNIRNTQDMSFKDFGELPMFRFVHIDGCHEEVAVFNDLCNFSINVLEKGVIALDDFNDSEYPGVNRACFKFMDKHNWCIFAIGYNKAYLCKTKHRDFYLKGLLNSLKTTVDDGNKFMLSFKLRQLAEKNVVLCFSRESTDIDSIINDIDAPPIIG